MFLTQPPLLLLILVFVCLESNNSLKLLNSLFTSTSSSSSSTSSSQCQDFNLPKLDLYEFSDGFYIRRFQYGKSQYLKLSIKALDSLQITQPASLPMVSPSDHLLSAEGIFGLYKLEQGYYLAVIKSSSPALLLSGIEGIREITEVRFIHLTSSSSSLSEATTDNKILRLLLEAIRRHTFYYSATDYDFTKTLQSNRLIVNNNITNSPNGKPSSSWRYADDRFFWNLNVLSEFISQGVDDVWIVPVTNCWICSDVVYKDNLKRNNYPQKNGIYTLSIISRRSRYRQGPRYVKRGVDTQGHVANMVETEQILCNSLNGQVSSFVQTRGSIPLFWKQPEVWQMRPSIQVAPNIQMNAQALKTHFVDTIKRFVTLKPADSNSNDGSTLNSMTTLAPTLTIINLIDKKGFQGELGRWFAYCLYYACNTPLLDTFTQLPCFKTSSPIVNTLSTPPTSTSTSATLTTTNTDTTLSSSSTVGSISHLTKASESTSTVSYPNVDILKGETYSEWRKRVREQMKIIDDLKSRSLLGGSSGINIDNHGNSVSNIRSKKKFTDLVQSESETTSGSSVDLHSEDDSEVEEEVEYIKDRHEHIFAANDVIPSKFLSSHRHLMNREKTSVMDFNLPFATTATATATASTSKQFQTQVEEHASLLKSAVVDQSAASSTTEGKDGGSDHSVHTHATLPVKLLWFDYHKKCSHGNVGSISAIRQLLSGLFTSSHTGGDSSTSGIDSGCIYVSQVPGSSSGDEMQQQQQQQIQTHLIRTNCIDCLDRTNVVQTALARWSLALQLKALSGLNLLDETADGKQNFTDELLEQTFRRMWGDNGDNISLLYAGTCALKRDVTRLGRRTRRGAIDDGINSAMRYYINNYQDTDRQIGVDALLGYIDGSGVLGVLSLEKWKLLDKEEVNDPVHEENEEEENELTDSEESDLETVEGDDISKEIISVEDVFADLGSDPIRTDEVSLQHLNLLSDNESKSMFTSAASLPKIDSILSDINDSLKNIMKIIQ